MAYVTGGIVTANSDPDFNAMATDINEVFADAHSGSTTESVANFGYGQTIVTPTVAPNQIITAAQWNTFFSTITDCATHQGTDLDDVPASVNAGDIIDAFDGGTGTLAVLTAVINNRLTIAPAQATTTTSGTKDSSQRTTSWTVSTVHEITVDFGSYDDARYYFNTGGQIHFSGSRSGGSANTANTNWTDILSTMGTVKFKHTTTDGVTGQSTALGFYNLTGSFQSLFTKQSGGYAGDYYELEGRNDGSGVLRFRATFYTSGTPDGTLNSYVDEKRSTGTFLIPSPTYTTISDI